MKKQYLLSLLLAAACLASVRAQTTHPLVQNQSGAMTQSSPAERAKKLQKAREIYDKLVKARGDSRYPVPVLTLEPTEKTGAIMYYDVPEIMIEEKAFDVCARFKEDMDAALAMLLGHELTHYYEKHGWRKGFVSEYRGLNINMKLDSIQEKVGNETQADYIGGFLAYTAGFGTFDKGSLLMQAIYDAYQLKDEYMPGYPKLEDRKALSISTAQKIKSLVEVFDMANLLAVVDRYSEARQYYLYVLKEYQSREIYNNLGVLGVLEARKYFAELEFKYHLPLELDLESSSSARGPEELAARQKLLEEALRYLDAAISLDPNYAPAYLNKACAYALLGDLTRAQFYAETEAIQCANKYGPAKTASDAKVLLGILAAIRGESVQAQKILETEKANKNALAGINLKILLNQPLDKPKPTLDRAEYIEEVDLEEYTPSTIDSLEIKIGSGVTFYQDLMPGTSAKIFMSAKNGPRPSVFFQTTPPKYQGESARKISLGMDRAAIVEAYGAPQRTVETPRGEILRYEKIIFILGPAGKLERWVNYVIKR